MMNIIREVVPRVLLFGRQNAPVLLTVAGIGGFVTSLGMAVSTTRLVTRRSEALPAYSTHAEELRIHWRMYIPTVSLALASAIAIVAGHSINSRRGAALLGAYKLTEKALTEYQEQVVEIVGSDVEKKIRESVSVKQVQDNPTGDTSVIFSGTGKQLCFDSYTSRYFESDMETIRKAQNTINERILSQDYVSHNEFYNELGLENSIVGEQVGWNTTRLLSLRFDATLNDRGVPVMVIDYERLPLANYYQIGRS